MDEVREIRLKCIDCDDPTVTHELVRNGAVHAHLCRYHARQRLSKGNEASMHPTISTPRRHRWQGAG